ncbi:MAG: hypothetical protein ACI9BS_001130 [Candidatus Poriferisodalaceae bacterium]|jgi:hypothetical protein
MKLALIPPDQENYYFAEGLWMRNRLEFISKMIRSPLDTSHGH